MCWLSWNLGTSAFCNPQGLSRPVTGIAFATLLFPFFDRQISVLCVSLPIVLCTVEVFSLDRHVTDWPEIISVSIRFSDVETSLNVSKRRRQNALKVAEISWELYLSWMHRSDPRFLRKTCSCAMSDNLYCWCLAGCMKKKDVEDVSLGLSERWNYKRGTRKLCGGSLVRDETGYTETLKSWCRFCVVKGRMYITSLSVTPHPHPLEIKLCWIAEF